MRLPTLRKPILWLFLSVLVGTLFPLAQLVPQPAYADYISDARKQERLYEYGVAVGDCIGNGSGIHTENLSLTKDGIPGAWMNGGKVTPYFGNILILPDKSSPWCGDILANALNAFGYTSADYGAFLKDLHYSCTATECNLPNGTPQQSIPQYYKDMLAARGVPTSQTNGMKYVVHLDGMKSYCAMTGISSPTDAQKAAAEANQDGLIMVYSTTNQSGALTAEKSYYKYDRVALDADKTVATSTDGACIEYAATLRDTSKLAVDGIINDFGATSKQKYLAAALNAACGSADTPRGDRALGSYEACTSKITAAFSTCWDSTLTNVARFGSDTKDAFPTTLAGCLEGPAGVSKDTLLPTFLQVQASLTDLAGSLTTTDPLGNPTDDNCPLPAGTSLRWLGCAVFDGLKGVADGLAKALNSLLYTPTSIFDEPAAQKAAATFRNIGIALVVIAALFMIIAEASGWQIVDAYTIRKLMPRLAIVLVAIALAWPILRLIVTLTNDLGALIHSVFLQLAGDAQAGGGEVGTGSSLAKVVGLVFAGGAGFIYVAFLGALGFLSLLGTVALALFIGLFVLGIRQLVVLMCIILAPLAFAAYVLPGTQKLWAFWKNTFITTLLMYPLIMGFIGAGKAMAFLLGATQAGSTDNIMQMLVIIVYFAPYFMLPFAFKMAGGLMSTIFSLANDKNRGLFDRMRNFRKNSTKKRFDEYATGQRGKNFFGKRAADFAVASRSIGDPGIGLRGLRTKEGRDAARNKLAEHHAMEALRNNSLAWTADDAALAALQDETTTDRASYLRNYVKHARDRGATDPDHALREKAESSLTDITGGTSAGLGTRQMQIAAHKALQYSKTGYDDTEKGVARRISDTQSMVKRGLMTVNEAAGWQKQSQRAEASQASYSDWIKVVQGGYYNDAGGWVSLEGDEAVGHILDSANEYMTPGAIVTARKESMELLAGRLKKTIADAHATYIATTARASEPDATEADIVAADKATERLASLMGTYAGVRDTINSHAQHLAGTFAELSDTGLGEVEVKIAMRDVDGKIMTQKEEDGKDIKDSEGRSIAMTQTVKQKMTVRRLEEALKQGQKDFIAGGNVDELINKYLNRRREWSSSDLAATGGAPPGPPIDPSSAAGGGLGSGGPALGGPKAPGI